MFKALELGNAAEQNSQGLVPVTSTFSSTGSVVVASFPFGTPYAGSVTVTGSGFSVNLPNAPAVNGVTVLAHAGNAQLVKGVSGGAVGTSSGVTQTSGCPISPGATLGFAISNANLLWVNGQTGDVFGYVVS